MFYKYKLMKYFAVMLILLSLSFNGCAKKEAEKKVVSAAVPVKVSNVQLKDLHKTLEYVGNIKAQDEVMIFPKITGKIIEKVKKEGEPVNKDEVIAYVDRDEVGLTFNKAPITSPLTGTLGRLYVDKGSSVGPQSAVGLVVNMDVMKIQLDTPEQYLPKIYLNQEADITVDAYGKEVFKGVITQISPIVNLENRAAPVEITIDNKDHRIKSGMFARVTLVLEEHKNVPVILKEAVIGKSPDTFVYVIENKKAILKKISLGIHQGSEFEVTEGLKQNDAVVIMGQQKLFENAEVMVVEK
jgi:membrane fusion protein, multidrug efflux system